MADDLAAELKQFIVQHIESLAQLEVLLYLRQHKERQVHPGEIASRLALTPEMSNVILADITRRGFAAQSEAHFRYQPASNEIAHLLEMLAESYRTRRVTVTTQIYSRPVERMKTFADAFRFRKEK